MNAHHPPEHHDAAVDRWLNEHQHVLESGLGSLLDIEAGLQEVLLQSRHSVLGNDLDTVLDVEAGLAAILPAKPPSAPVAQSGLRTEERGHTTVEQFLRSVSPESRLLLRRRPVVVSASRHLEEVLTLNDILTRAHRLAHGSDRIRDPYRIRYLIIDLVENLAHASDLAHDMALNFMLPHLLVRDLTHIYEIVGNLSLDLTHASSRVNDRPLISALSQEQALALAHTLARVFALALARTDDLIGFCVDQVRRAIALALGQDLPVLHKELIKAFLDDFTTADLRAANVISVDLTGVQWSESRTKWSEEMDVEALKARSKETGMGSGIYVVQSGPATVRGFADLA
ncbi:hypothetical protein [Streptosporangium carneum]|uniref:Uncharacterized protein n=1 Tax=Streptosporangium carneum TaxID=47481 RepID=A0A9W6I9J7_9ACTN|nr:hypothetical protein [Streptosporangium carneum]GLK13489.1 hypothetical protein GCM10017600_69000 [Streptosporangium carneum]